VSATGDYRELQAILSRHDPQAISFRFVDATVDPAPRVDDDESDRDDQFRYETPRRRVAALRQGREPMGRRLCAEPGLSPIREVEFGMDVHSVSSFPDE
jgi:hypothetical protein